MFYNNQDFKIKLIFGQLSALAGACTWLIIATFYRMLVSGTHSIVGATAGFALVQLGLEGIQWMSILKIVISWFISPLLSGFFSLVMFISLKYFVLSKEHSLEPALMTLPIIYGIAVLVNAFSILYGGFKVFSHNYTPLWIIFPVSFCLSIIAALIVYFTYIPRLRKKILLKLNQTKGDLPISASGDSDPNKKQNRFTRVFAYFMTLLHRFWTGTTDSIPLKRVGNPVDGDCHAIDINTKDPKTFYTNQPVKDCKESSPLPNHGIDRHFNFMKIRKIQNTVPINENGRYEEIVLFPESISNEQQNSISCNGRLIDDLSNQGICPDVVINIDTIASIDSCLDNDAVSVQTKAETEATVLEDKPEEVQVFSVIQVLTAVFGSFAHGGNDVSNAIGPLIGLWMVYQGQNIRDAPENGIWILLYGGIGISLGLWVWGRRVIKTIGSDLTKITPSSGISIELGSAITVLIASMLGIPISTTHCKVGSVVLVGRYRSRVNVDWRLFINIIVSWAITLPISAGVSGLIMYILVKIL